MAQPTGLYRWIESNDVKSTSFFLGFVIAIQVIAALVLFIPLSFIDPGHMPVFNTAGYLLRYAPLVLAASVVWFACQMVWHIETVKRAVGFRFIDNADEPQLCSVIEPLIVMMGLPVPFVAVIESPARNAFACGVARKKAAVVVTRGLIDSLDDEELACVLAHELSHIKNGDIRLMAAANIFMAALTRLHLSNGMKFTPGHAVLSLALPVVLPLTLAGTFIGHVTLRAGQVSRLLISSSREFIADAEAVQVTKNPAALASALVKVERNHCVAGARREDDSMMIAGATEGVDATHPTVVQRIAALARTTGSMVFNAPSAPRWDLPTTSATLAEAEAAATLRSLPAARALHRIRARAPENFLGLTRGGTILAAATLGVLLYLHAHDIGNPRALLAMFDIRPLSTLLGTQAACLRTLWGSPGRCGEHDVPGDPTLPSKAVAGWLATISQLGHQSGPFNPGAILKSLRWSESRPYTGQSGRLRGTTAEFSSDGTFYTGSGTFSSAAPEKLRVAEIKGVGCFPARLLHGEPQGHFPLNEEISGVTSLRRLIESANQSLVSAGEPGTSASDEWLRRYARNRETLVLAGYDSFGLAGLREMRDTYRRVAHNRVIDLIRDRLSDPAFTAGLDAIETAKIKALAKAPDKFVPCPAVTHGAFDDETIGSN